MRPRPVEKLPRAFFFLRSHVNLPSYPLEPRLEGYFVIARSFIRTVEAILSEEIASSPPAPRNDNEYGIQTDSAVQTSGGSAQGHRSSHGRSSCWREISNLAWRHWIRKDVHDGERHRKCAA